MDMQIGNSVGAWARKHGAVRFMARVAQGRLDVPQPPSRMIVWQDMQTGWLVGVLAKRLGAAKTRAKVVHLLLEDVLEKQCVARSPPGETYEQHPDAGASAPSSGVGCAQPREHQVALQVFKKVVVHWMRW